MSYNASSDCGQPQLPASSGHAGPLSNPSSAAGPPRRDPIDELLPLVARRYRHVPCVRLYIDILDLLGTDSIILPDGTPTSEHELTYMPNHAVLKMDFGSEMDGIHGLTIDMAADYDQCSVSTESLPDVSLQPGHLLVTAADRPGGSEWAVLTAWIGINGSPTVQELLRPILERGMQWFDFSCVEGHFNGCRDFMTQSLYQLWGAGLAAPNVMELTIGEELLKQPRMAGHSLEGLSITTAWQALALRVRPDGRCFQHPMDPGRFLDYRRQVDLNYMVYPDSVVTRADTDRSMVVVKRGEEASG